MRITACDRCDKRIEPTATFYTVLTFKVEGLEKVDSSRGAYFISRELCSECHENLQRWINEPSARLMERGA